MAQVFNPYLPFHVCIPDGEPHVFGDRVYVYGSHDKEAGEKFCMLDYEVWSAPVDDLSAWRCEGISYRAVQDPGYGIEGNEMYAPDVVQGNDGRYYLYYALAGISFTAPLHVAVSDTPAGPFEYYGYVRNPDGSVMTKDITFDPGVINDNGRIWLYYGWSLARFVEENDPDFPEKLVKQQMEMFGKTEEQVRAVPGVMGANVVELEDDMLTVKHEPKRLVPGAYDADGTCFENHAFFEASSIRKFGDTYYYIYSSQWLNELCYATSKYPDRDFVFGGTLVSNGDVGIQGRTLEHPVAGWGNNHGSVAYINGKYYIFYHRQTHAHAFSRQACAEEITMLPNGHFLQAEMTSCGLNGGPLKAEGSYSAMIACQLYRDPMGMTDDVPKIGGPYLTNDGDARFATKITDGTRVGFKYFDFSGNTRFGAAVRGNANGKLWIRTDNETIGCLTVVPAKGWTTLRAGFTVAGKQAIYLDYEGEGSLDLLEIEFYK